MNSLSSCVIKKFGKNKIKKKVFSIKLLVLLIIILCAFTFGLSIGRTSDAEQSASINFDKVVSYDSVCVSKGDTIWSIAEAHMQIDDKVSLANYVEKIKYVNDMASDEIQSGRHLIIPTYSIN